jgi:Fe2+ transport system protein FeoA
MRIIIIGAIRRAVWRRSGTAGKDPVLKDSFKSTLASLKRGQKGVIKAVDTADPVVQRLMVLGLVNGAELQFTGAAIGGDPLEFRLFGNGISLRRAQALHFEVVVLGESG